VKNKTTLVLAHRMNQIEKQINDLSIEYNMIIHELHRRNPNLINDVNLQPKETLEILIDNLISGNYQDDLGEYTRIYPLNECCKERLKVVKKKVRKYED
jgi:superfamily I DNA and RNA helicase